MPSDEKDAKSSELDELRREAGRILKGWRKARQMLQGELAKRIAIRDGSFISQVEAGNRRLPPELFEAYAAALEVEPREFAMVLMRYYDPHLYEIIFSEEAASPPAAPKRSDRG